LPRLWRARKSPTFSDLSASLLCVSPLRFFRYFSATFMVRAVNGVFQAVTPSPSYGKPDWGIVGEGNRSSISQQPDEQGDFQLEFRTSADGTIRGHIMK